MKNLFLIKTEILSNLSTVIMVIVQMIFALVCVNLCMVSIKDHVGTILYFGGVDTDNAVSVYCSVDSANNYDDILKMEDVNDGFYTRYYYSDIKSGDTVIADKIYIAAVSDSILTSKNAFLSKEQKNSLVQDCDNGIPAIVTEDMADTLHEGDLYTLDNGVVVYIAGIIKNNTIQYICNAMTNGSFVMILDNSRLDSLNKHSLDCIFLTLKNNNTDESIKEINELDKNINAVQFELNNALSYNYSKMATLLVFGIVILIISVIGYFSGSYFTYKKNEPVYIQYKILGADNKKMFVILLGVQIFEVFAACVFSFAGLFAIGKITGMHTVTLTSFIISIIVFMAMIFIYLLLCLRKTDSIIG